MVTNKAVLSKGFFSRALLIISHHDKHKAKCVLLGAHLAIVNSAELKVEEVAILMS